MLPELSDIFLDLDCTLIESVGIKDEAFRDLFADYPDKLPEIMAYHMAHNAVVRFDKFKHIVPNILGEPLAPACETELATRFSSLVLEKIIKTENTPGALSFLKKYKDVIPMVLISMTPDGELRDIVKRRGLAPFFNRIYGADWKKDVAMANYMGELNIQPENCVYIGDTPEDFMFSSKAGVTFVGRDSGRSFDDQPSYLFSHMDDVAGCVETLFNITK